MNKFSLACTLNNFSELLLRIVFHDREAIAMNIEVVLDTDNKVLPVHMYIVIELESKKILFHNVYQYSLISTS